MADTIITVGGETSQLERDIQKTLSKDFKLTGLDTKSFAQPLGKIKGQLGEFEKSLEASNARVVAFGASAGSIYLLTDAFKSMVKSTIDVEKTLADINTVINASEKDIQSFGNTIFDVANKTSQSFETAAEAALEFSRQGLGLEQTAKRTADALTLARLSGLSAASSVEALTAAVNSFSEAGLSTTQVVNKLAAVDAKYAVSSADLAEAIKRVGSSASEAGVNIDQLVALVTSAQQTTARGGAVIGNSFKTIFTRLQRPKVLDDLKEIGIQTTSVSGETLPLIQIITQLARTFDNLGSAQRSQVAELVGGVYQINILKAVLGDLSKEYSTYSGALKASSGATNEAEARIAKLGETLDSQINRVTNNLKRAGSVIGGMTIAPALEKILSNVNGVLETFALGKEPEGFGEKAAVGFLKGLGNFISGPGLMIAAVGAFQIFRRLAVFVGDAGKTILGLGQAAQQQAQIQAQILQLLQKNPQVYSQIESGAISVQSAAQGYLNIVNATNAALERQKAIAAQMTGVAMGGGVPVIPTSGRGGKRGRAAGYMPSISDQKRMEERDARNLGAPSGVRAHFGKGTIGGKKFLMNNHEIEIPGYGANGDSAVIPKYAAGLNPRFVKNMSSYIGGFKYGKANQQASIDNTQASGAILSDKNKNEKYKRIEKTLNDKDLKNRVQANDIVKVSLGNNWEKYEPLNGRSALKYEEDAINKYGFISSKGSLKYGGTSSVDGWKRKQDGFDLLEVKSGGRSISDVIRKFQRMPFENAAGVANSLFTPGKDIINVTGTLVSANSSGFIPRFAAGDGSVSLKDYMMMKYGEVKDASSLGGAALNAAYGKGVSLDELRGVSPKWANWTPGGATSAMLQGRKEAKKQTQINRANKYGYRKIILPWSKSVADFGGDPNEFGDAYENLVAQKFGAKRGDRFKRANDYPGIAGRTPQSKYNYTDVDFIVPKNPDDLSAGGSLIEARGGDKKNYNASDISKKFDNFFKNNPSYDSKKWKRLLVARNAAGYIPRAAFGFNLSEEEFAKSNLASADLDAAKKIKEKEKARQEARKRFRERTAAARKARLDKKLEGTKRRLEGVRNKTVSRGATPGEAASASAKASDLQAKIAEQEAKFRARESARAAREASMNAGKKTAAQYTAEKSFGPRSTQTGFSVNIGGKSYTSPKANNSYGAGSSYGNGSSILKSIERNRKKVEAEKAAQQRIQSKVERAVQNAAGGGAAGGGGGGGHVISGGPGGPGGPPRGPGGSGKITGKGASSTTGAANSGGIGNSAFLLSMMLSQGLGMAQSSGLIDSKTASGRATESVINSLNMGVMASSLAGSFGPDIAKSSIGKKVGSMASKVAGSRIASTMSMGRLAGVGTAATGLGGMGVTAPLLAAYVTGKVGSEAIDYYGVGGHGSKNIDKEIQDYQEKIAGQKTDSGKAISEYTSLIKSSHGGVGTKTGFKAGAYQSDTLGRLYQNIPFIGGDQIDLMDYEVGKKRKEAASGMISNLGGMESVKRVLKEQGGGINYNNINKTNLEETSKILVKNLQDAGKEVGDLGNILSTSTRILNKDEYKRSMLMAKEVTKELLLEVKNFERLKFITKAFNETSSAMATLAAKGNMVLTVLRDLSQKEAARGEMLKQNFGGGVEGYLNPSQNAEAVIAMDKALKVITDPRLMNNKMERGRAAGEYLNRANQLGIDISPEKRSQITQMMAEGMKQFQGQNFAFLSRLAGSFGDPLGLREGMVRSDKAMGGLATKADSSIEQYMLDRNPQAVQAGILNKRQLQTMPLYGNKKAAQPYLDTERKIKETMDMFDRLTQGFNANKVSPEAFFEVKNKMEEAARGQANVTNLTGQQEVLRKMEAAFSGLDARLMNIARFGDQFTQAVANVNVGGSLKVDLSADAKKLIDITDAIKEAQDANGGPPSRMTKDSIVLKAQARSGS